MLVFVLQKAFCTCRGVLIMTQNVYTIRCLANNCQDQTLLRSLILAFGRRPQAEWQLVSDNYADVLLISTDYANLMSWSQYEEQARHIIYYTSDSRLLKMKSHVLLKPARPQDLVNILDKMAAELNHQQEPLLPLSKTLFLHSTVSLKAILSS